LAVLALAPGPLWDNDLSRLTPVPLALLKQYESLQRELGAPDVRYLLALDGSSPEDVLEQEERLTVALRALEGRGAIAGFDLAARYLPSAATQERRRAALPMDAELRAALGRASAERAFRAGIFAPFLQDVAKARSLAPLTAAGLAGTPLELSLGSLIIKREGVWTGLVTFNEVQDPGALAGLAAQSGGKLVLLDLKEAAEELVAHQRVRILWCLGAAAAMLALVVLLALRSGARAVRVLAPLVLSSLCTLAVLHAAGVTLNLFHLIALVLAAGLGLDYGLFFERSMQDGAGQRRTLHAISVCAAAACIVFAVLACSALPILQSLGVTVVLGVVGNFGLALLLIPAQRRPAAA
jgi:predicted exporter